MTTLGMEKTLVAEVALVGVIVVMNVVAVEMLTVDLVLMEAIFKVLQATMTLTNTIISLQILDPGREKLWKWTLCLHEVEIQSSYGSSNNSSSCSTY